MGLLESKFLDITEEIFDAPWCMTTCGTEEKPEKNCVSSNHFDLVAKCATRNLAYRVQFLPILFDCLAEAALGKCWSCSCVGNIQDLLDNGCRKNKDECYVARWIKVLQNMRRGV